MVRIMRPSAERPLAAGEKFLYPVKSLLCEIFTAFDRRLIVGVRPTLRDQNTFNWG
jgi:hypothetical protein